MNKEELSFIFNQFDQVAAFVEFQELNSGHINDTFLIKTTEKPHYILQKINGNVFKNVEALIKNKVFISQHLQGKMNKFSKEYIHKNELCFTKAKSGAFFYKDNLENYWNLSFFIADSITYEKTPSKEIAFEAGKITGDFLNNTADVDCDELETILPDFHSVTQRYNQFLEALNTTSEKQKEQAKTLINFVQTHISKMQVLDVAIAEQKLPIRVTHNDTKISNILFSKNQKAICLIDTDTVMPGVLHFDYGDAIRTICNAADEDEKDINKVQFQMEYFKAYTLGFSERVKKSCTDNEIDYLPISIQILPFIMGLRFLTDFLNNNKYYKIKYPLHNFDRTQNQFALVTEIQTHFEEVKEYISTVFKK